MIPKGPTTDDWASREAYRDYCRRARPAGASIWCPAIEADLMDPATLKGQTTLTWDGRNEQGMPVATGTYFVVVKEGDSATTKKIILQR